MCFAPQRRALSRHLNFQKWSEHVVFLPFWLGNVLRATTVCTFLTSQLPESGLRPWVFDTFDLEMCFAPQRRVLFRQLNFQKCSEREVLPFRLGNVLRATMARTFSSLIWPAGSAHTNVLEVTAVLTEFRRSLRDPAMVNKRFMNIVDSMVTYFAVTKGRSGSKRLNRPLRRLMALNVASKSVMITLWTFSKWNFADAASRRFERWLVAQSLTSSSMGISPKTARAYTKEIRRFSFFTLLPKVSRCRMTLPS